MVGKSLLMGPAAGLVHKGHYDCHRDGKFLCQSMKDYLLRIYYEPDIFLVGLYKMVNTKYLYEAHS